MKDKRILLALSLLALLPAVILFAPGSSLASRELQPVSALPIQDRVFSGHVYAGHRPDTSSPLRDVLVTLYGSNHPLAWGIQLHAARTDENGAYALGTDQIFEYYHIVETDPAGYSSTDVVAGPDGMEITLNWIRHYLVSPGTYVDNLFWDQKPPTATPEPTHPPEPT